MKPFVQNLAVLRTLPDAPVKILLAQKAFSMFSVYPLIRERYLAGTTASGLVTRHGSVMRIRAARPMSTRLPCGGEFRARFLSTPTTLCSTVHAAEKPTAALPCSRKSCGLRLNPECSTQPSDHAMYDPCGPDSRLGIDDGILSRSC